MIKLILTLLLGSLYFQLASQEAIKINPKHIHGITPGSKITLESGTEDIQLIVNHLNEIEYKDIINHVSTELGVEENILYYTSTQSEMEKVGDFGVGFAGELMLANKEIPYVIIDQAIYNQLTFTQKFFLISHEIAHHLGGHINNDIEVMRKYREHAADHLAGFIMGLFAKKYPIYKHHKMTQKNINKAVSSFLGIYTTESPDYPSKKSRISSVINGFNEGYNFE